MSHSNSHNSPVRDIDIRVTINVAWFPIWKAFRVSFAPL